MYGQEKLSSHYILSYGLTKEFFQGYKKLRYLNIEIPPTLIRSFQAYFKPWVIKNRVRSSSVEAMRNKHQMTTIAQAHIAISRKTTRVRDLSTVPHRTTILIHAKLIDFALHKLKRENVILLLGNIHDEKLIQGRKIPAHFQIVKIHHDVNKVKLSTKTIQHIRRYVNERGSKLSRHPIFGSSNFNAWMIRRAIHSAKLIQLLETLIRKNPIGLIIDQSEIANPGNTLSLLAKKYNLPFVLMPQVLVTDFSLLPSRASYYFVWGTHMKKWMEKRGIPPQKIKVTGCLRFQYALENTRFTTIGHFTRSNLPQLAHKPIKTVAYFSQTYERTVSAEIMNWIHETAKKNRDIHFLIKTHPSDLFKYDSYKKTTNIHLLPKDVDLYQVIDHSDIVMTISSNTAIEAALLNKSIIVLQPKIPYHFDKNNNDYYTHLARAAAGPIVRNEHDLTKHVNRYFDDDRFKQQTLKQAQQFLKQTLQTSRQPANVTYMLIRNILYKKGKEH